MSNLNFAETHNLVAFLEKPDESNGFEGIIDFLNASYIRYALIVNPTINTTCIQQFWDSTKAKTVNEERQIQALVDKKKVMIFEASIRRDLQFDDAEVLRLLPGMNSVALLHLPLFALQQIRSSTSPMFLDKQVGDMYNYYNTFDAPCHTKKVFANMKRESKGFFGRVTPLFATMMVQAPQEEGKGSTIPTDPHPTPSITQPSRPHKKQARRKQMNETKIPETSVPTEHTVEETNKHVSLHSNDPPLSGEDRLKLSDMMEICVDPNE
ncbi:hypothetical protein Tco_0518045 [Tanacetum coccineum]